MTIKPMTIKPVKLCALCRLPREQRGSKTIDINGHKRWVHIHCANNSKD